jgi:hypothetical protein
VLENLPKERRRKTVIAALVAVVAWLAGMISWTYGVTTGTAGGIPSMVFTIAWFVGTPAIAFILFRAAFPLGVFTAPLNQVAAVAAGIKGSAKKLGPLVCAGHIGWVHYGGPLLRLHIYSHGVIIHPVLLPEIPLQFQEISTPTRREGWFFSRLSLSLSAGGAS